MANTSVPIEINTLAGPEIITCYQTCEMSSTLWQNFVLKKDLLGIDPQVGRFMVLDKGDFTIQPA